MEILTNVQLFLLCPDGDVVSFTGAEQTITMELASAEIEDHIGVEMLPVEAGLKMEMGGSGTSCAPSQRNGLPCLDPVTRFDEVFGVVAINGLQTVVMPDNNHVAISRVGFGHPYNAIKSSHDRVVGLRLDVHARMVPASASVG